MTGRSSPVKGSILVVKQSLRGNGQIINMTRDDMLITNSIINRWAVINSSIIWHDLNNNIAHCTTVVCCIHYIDLYLCVWEKDTWVW
jgi:hypothetical protein